MPDQLAHRFIMNCADKLCHKHLHITQTALVSSVFTGKFDCNMNQLQTKLFFDVSKAGFHIYLNICSARCMLYIITISSELIWSKIVTVIKI